MFVTSLILGPMDMDVFSSDKSSLVKIPQTFCLKNLTKIGCQTLRLKEVVAEDLLFLLSKRATRVT